MPSPRSRNARGLGVVVAVAAASLFIADTVSAQNLFDFLFGRARPRGAAPPMPLVDPADDPRGAPYDILPPSSVAGAAYCVRLCDGRYFPLARHAGGAPDEMCRAFCPAAKTGVFAGGAIDRAAAADGTRYANLPNAYLYRDRLVAGCTCNGRDAFGLARIDPKSDPTLRPGDLVAEKDGLAAFAGWRGDAAQFTHVDPARLPKNLRFKVSGAETTGAAPAAETTETDALRERHSRGSRTRRFFFQFFR